MIRIVNKNLLDSDAQAIFHSCNAFCTMGAGTALALRNRWPEVYEADCQTKRGDWDKMGTFSIAVIGAQRYVLNAYTQYSYGRDFRYVNYEYLYECLEKSLVFILNNRLKTIAFPYGLSSVNAGGDFSVVFAMIKSVFENTNIDVEICRLDYENLIEV